MNDKQKKMLKTILCCIVGYILIMIVARLAGHASAVMSYNARMGM